MNVFTLAERLAEQVSADTGLDLAAYAVAGLPATVGAITALFLAVKSLRHNAEIRDQVSNDHTTNLRDDLDHVRDLVERLGAEIREDRVARRDADRDIIAHVDITTRRIDEKVDAAIAKHHPEEEV